MIIRSSNVNSFPIKKSEVEDYKKRFRKGQKIKIPFEVSEENKRVKYVMETCRITGVYPHLITFTRPCGIETSYTYVDLIILGV